MFSLETTFYLRDKKLENVDINNFKVFQLLIKVENNIYHFYGNTLKILNV